MLEAFAIWLVTVVFNIAGGSALGTALIFAIPIVITVGASMAASRLLAPKMPSMGDLNDRGIMTRSPTSARQIIYGQCKVSGTVVFLATSGTKNEYLHIVVTLAGHEVEEIGSVYFNEDEVLTGSGDGYATGKYAASGSYTGSLIHKHLGTTTQTVDSTLQSDFPVDWDSNHRLQGIAYIYCKLTFSNEIFVGGIPNISCVVKGKKVYNPSTLATAYSANPALCLRDYLTDADLGMGMDASEIDDTSVIAAAAVCDGQVEIKPVTSPATYENRYECNGQAVTSSTPDSIIGQILSSMGGTIAYSGGQVVVYAAAYRSPTVTLDETNMAGGFTVSTRLSARDRVNAVKGTFISSENQWAAADFPQITSATYLADDDGIYHWRDVILPFTTSSSAAQRIARINLRQAREEIIFTAKFNLTAMQLRAGDTVMLTNANLGFSSKVFEVIAWSLSSQGTPPTPVIELQLRETASTVYDWDVTDEVAVESAPNTTLPNPFSIDPPTNLTLTADGTTQFIQADGSVMPRIKVAWSAPTEQFVTSGGKTVIEYKEGTATTYLTWATVDGDQALDFISSDVRIGTSYNVRLYAQSFFNTSSTYTAVSSITPAKDTTAPSIPTGLSAVVGTGRAVSLDWNDNTEPDFSEYGIYRFTSPVTASAVKIAEVRASRFVDTDVTIGTTYFYWVNAYDSVENVSGFATYATATPVAVPASSTDSTAPDTPAVFAISGTTQPATYVTASGQLVGRRIILLPAMPTGGKWMNLLYRVNGGTNYSVAAQSSVGAVDIPVDDLAPGASYDFAVQAFSAFGVGSALRTITGSPLVIPGDLVAPDATTGFSATAQPGFIDLFWYPSASNTVNEYQIWRSIVSAVSSFGLIADTPGNQFQDTAVTAGTQYWYKVFAVSASEIVSTGLVANGGAGVVALIAPSGSLPSSPTAPAQPASPVVGTYDASDGSVFAFATFEIYALTSGAKLQNLLYRRTGSGDWLVAGQFKNTTTSTLRLDDLSPGIGYDIATQSWNSTGGSAVVTGTTFTAGTKITAPGVPTSFTHVAGNNSAYSRPPSTLGTIVGYSCRNNWTPPSDKDLIGYEWAILGATGSDPVGNGFFTTEPEAISVLSGPVTSYLYVRSKNRTGIFSAWVTDSVNLNTSHLQPAGSMMMQSAGTIAITGGTVTGITVSDLTSLQLSTGSTAVSLTAFYASNEVITLTGGATAEVVSIDITNRGFSAKPSVLIIQVEDVLYAGFYDQTNGGNSATSAKVVIYRNDGGTLASGNLRVDIIAAAF